MDKNISIKKCYVGMKRLFMGVIKGLLFLLLSLLVIATLHQVIIKVFDEKPSNNCRCMLGGLE